MNSPSFRPNSNRAYSQINSIPGGCPGDRPPIACAAVGALIRCTADYQAVGEFSMPRARFLVSIGTIAIFAAGPTVANPGEDGGPAGSQTRPQAHANDNGSPGAGSATSASII